MDGGQRHWTTDVYQEVLRTEYDRIRLIFSRRSRFEALKPRDSTLWKGTGHTAYGKNVIGVAHTLELGWMVSPVLRPYVPTRGMTGSRTPRGLCRSWRLSTAGMCFNSWQEVTDDTWLLQR